MKTFQDFSNGLLVKKDIPFAYGPSTMTTMTMTIFFLRQPIRVQNWSIQNGINVNNKNARLWKSNEINPELFYRLQTIFKTQ